MNPALSSCLAVARRAVREEAAGARGLRALAGGVEGSLRAAPALVDWTARYCAGFFTLVEPSGGAADISITHDAALLALLDAMDAACWCAEGAWARWCAQDAGAALIRVPTSMGHAYYFLPRQPEPLIIAVARDDPDGPMIAVRSLRSLLLARLEQRGALFLHSAAVASDAGCVLITGYKLAGKTTTLLHLIRDGFDLLSNDKVALTCADGDPVVTAQGFPIAVGVRIGTLAGIDRPAQVLAAACSPFTEGDLARAVAAHGGALHSADVKVRFYPNKFAAIYGARIAARRPVLGVLLSRFAPELPFQSLRLDEASAAYAIRAMRLAGLRAISPEHGFLAPGEVQATAQPDAIARTVASRVPVYRIRQNARSQASTAALVARLLGD